MKRVGILTIHNSPNYGACLQAYALYTYLSEQADVSCEMIDLHRPHEKGYTPSKRFKPYRSMQPNAWERIKIRLRKLLDKGESSDLYSIGARPKFEDFNRSIKLSRPYWGIDELYACPPDYDIYVTGSDQVWNPTQPYCLEPYFLTFVPKGKKKISYASSIAVTELMADEKQDFQRWLSDYDVISVRERHAQQLLAPLISRPVNLSADPTFLLDTKTWKTLAANPEGNSPYILLFTLDYDVNLLRFAIRISKEAGLRLIYLNQLLPNLNSEDCVALRDAGPKEFLGYIANSDMVITNSYHATVFSIILETKCFYTYIAGYNQRGSRIVDLLTTFGLQPHLLRQDLSEDYVTLSSRRIDWSRIREVTQRERDGGREFLKKALT